MAEGAVVLAPDSSTLSPLPSVLHYGLSFVGFFACLSLVSSISVFIYLTYRLGRWHVKTWDAKRRPRVSQSVNNLQLELAERHFVRLQDAPSDAERLPPQAPDDMSSSKSPNQFLILVYNLFLADIQQSTGFVLNVVWVSRNGIFVGTPACYAQAWLLSVGDLASSVFAFLIALHTYMTIVWDYKVKTWTFNTILIGTWIILHFTPLIGLEATHNGRSGGGFYVRASTWCWINKTYENYRLLTHYLWIFSTLILTSLIYFLIFFYLRQQKLAGAHNMTSSALSYSRHPTFLVYPIVYVACTAPLALGRVLTMAGAHVPLSYFCLAGALFASIGWLDVVVWGCTRRELIFTADVDTEKMGLETFHFMRTPHDREFGNMVWVQGASDSSNSKRSSRGGTCDERERGRNRERQFHPGDADSMKPPTSRPPTSENGSTKGWRTLRSASIRSPFADGRILGHKRFPKSSGSSKETLQPLGLTAVEIQMDMVTSVVVEVDDKAKSVDKKK